MERRITVEVIEGGEEARQKCRPAEKRAVLSTWKLFFAEENSSVRILPLTTGFLSRRYHL
jgi:hypothetical protein